MPPSRGHTKSTDAHSAGLGPLRTVIHEAQNISACEHSTGLWGFMCSEGSLFLKARTFLFSQSLQTYASLLAKTHQFG